MTRIAITIGYFLLMAGCCNNENNPEKAPEWTFHTTPDKWKEARIFQSPAEKPWSQRVVLEKKQGQSAIAEKIHSPNKAYWFCVSITDVTDSTPCTGKVTIYNEREYLLELNILQMRCSWLPKAKWINEKLIYIRVWLGRVLAIDLIIDVEEETIIYKEMTHWGSIPFIQWQQAKKEKLN